MSWQTRVLLATLVDVHRTVDERLFSMVGCGETGTIVVGLRLW